PLLDTAPLIRAPEGLKPSRSTRCSARNTLRSLPLLRACSRLPAASPPAPTTPRGGRKDPHLAHYLSSGHHPPARHYRVLVHIQPRTSFMHHIHSPTSFAHAAGVKPVSSNSTNRALGPLGPWQQSRVLSRLRVKLLVGLLAPGR